MPLPRYNIRTLLVVVAGIGALFGLIAQIARGDPIVNATLVYSALCAPVWIPIAFAFLPPPLASALSRGTGWACLPALGLGVLHCGDHDPRQFPIVGMSAQVYWIAFGAWIGAIASRQRWGLRSGLLNPRTVFVWNQGRWRSFRLPVVLAVAMAAELALCLTTRLQVNAGAVVMLLGGPILAAICCLAVLGLPDIFGAPDPLPHPVRRRDPPPERKGSVASAQAEVS